MYRHNAKLIRNVKKVLPYAKECAKRLKVIDNNLAKIESKSKQKTYYKAAEKKLIDEYDKDLRRFTYSQGKLLIKLIDRETGKTTYNNIKYYKSGFSAIIWQSFARLFGTSLKQDYNPKNEVVIESIINMLGYN